MNPLPIGAKVRETVNGWPCRVVLPPSWTDMGYIVELRDGSKILRYRSELEERA